MGLCSWRCSLAKCYLYIHQRQSNMGFLLDSSFSPSFTASPIDSDLLYANKYLYVCKPITNGNQLEYHNKTHIDKNQISF